MESGDGTGGSRTSSQVRGALGVRRVGDRFNTSLGTFCGVPGINTCSRDFFLPTNSIIMKLKVFTMPVALLLLLCAGCGIGGGHNIAELHKEAEQQKYNADRSVGGAHSRL